LKEASVTTVSIPTLSGLEVVRSLDKLYPKIKTPLAHEDAFQLLIATILSAQCTDAQVNRVTGTLFEKYPSPAAMSKATISDLETLVRSTGFYRVKSRRLKSVSKKIVNEFAGQVPKTMEELLTLPGVGRKTANIVLSAGFGIVEGVAVDTHVKRLAKRIGLSTQTDPEKIESELMKITPEKHWPRLSLLLILHGRRVCHARTPECALCPLTHDCLYYLEHIAN
jgi:endonuclease-3